MPLYKITLLVNEETEEMAYQLLALAIKKKYKKQVRPCIHAGDRQNDVYIVQNEKSQNEYWRKIAGQSYDY